MTIKIHPHKYTIYGWQNPRSIENVISIMRGIMDGNKIPSKALHTFNGGKSFEIACYEFGVFIAIGKGGHHSLIGAGLLQDRLDIDIESFEKKDKQEGIPESWNPINIKEISLAPKPDIYVKSSGKYPLPTLDEFFGKYKEINKALKHGSEDYSFTRREYKDLLDNVEEWKIPF